MIRVCLLIFLLFSFIVGNAQTKISGIVRSKEDGKVLPAVNVTVKEKTASGLLTYTMTNEKGAFQLNFKTESDSVVITIAGFNLKRNTETVSSKSQTLDFSVAAESIKLQEIKVTPPKIRLISDTLNYLVDGFIDKNDRTIGDILKKMPGITVKEDGSVNYNNKPINKFYIENRDLLQGRYGIATNNIEAKDVATVQVLENHQPVKALKDWEFTDEAAINLKLKDSAKGILTGNAQLGIGASPLLWNNELFSMFFNKGRQNMNTYKGNNTGHDAAAELRSFYRDDMIFNSSTSLAVQSPSAPGISRQRYLFNRSHAVSVNNLWALGSDYQLNANVSYLNDRQQKSSVTRSVYYLPADSLLTIGESLASIEHINLLDVSLQLSTNKDKYYLDNSLKITGQWNDERGDVMRSENILQNLNKPSFKIGNTFSLIRNFKKMSFNVYSFNGFNNTPQTLRVQPVLYEDLFAGDIELGSMHQSLNQEQFTSSNKVSIGLDHGSWKQNYTLGINANLNQLRSALQGEAMNGDLHDTADSLKNHLSWNRYEAVFTPNYTYSKEKLKLFFYLPVVYNYLAVNDEVAGHQASSLKNTDRLFFNPSFRLQYALNLFWNFSVRADYTNTLGGIDNGFTGYIMQSYRNLVKNDGQLPERNKQNYTVDFGYRHPIHAIFLNMGVGYSRDKRNLLYGYDYQGILSLRKTYEIPNQANNYLAYLRLSKGIDVISSTITLDADYNNSAASQISQGQVLDFTNTGYRFRTGISSKIRSWASLSYSFQYGRSKNKVDNDVSNFVPISFSTQRAQVNFFLAKGMVFNMGYENFYNSAIVSGSRVMEFANLGAKYTYKKIEFSLDYDNVFNVKQYISASYNETSTFYSAYNLRPAQVLLKVRFKVK